MRLCVTPVRAEKGTTLPPDGESCNCNSHAASCNSRMFLFCLSGDGSSWGQDRSSWDRGKEDRDEWLWSAASLKAGLHRFVLFVQPWMDILAVLLQAGYPRICFPPEAAYCTVPLSMTTRVWLLHPIRKPFNQEVTLIFETYGRKWLLSPAVDYLRGNIEQPRWCRLFSEPLKEVTEQHPNICGWPTVNQPPPAKTAPSRRICQMFS